MHKLLQVCQTASVPWVNENDEVEVHELNQKCLIHTCISIATVLSLSLHHLVHLSSLRHGCDKEHSLHIYYDS